MMMMSPPQKNILRIGEFLNANVEQVTKYKLKSLAWCCFANFANVFHFWSL